MTPNQTFAAGRMLNGRTTTSKSRVASVVRRALCLSALCLLPVQAIPVVAAPVGEIDSFLASVEANADLNGDQKQAILETFNKLRGDGVSEKQAITECLLQTYPQYKQAIADLDSDHVAAGVEKLEGLQDHSNRFLAADAAFYLGRTYLLNGQHEKAIQPLAKLSGEWSEQTLRDIESLYYLGTAQAGLLKNQEAMDTLVRFLQEDTDSPERLRMGAYSQVVKLQKIRQNTLEDAQNRMEYSHRRLEQQEPDQATQQQQQKVVDILNQLIEEAQKKECSSNCKGGKCNKKSDSNKPGKKPGQQKKPSQKSGQKSGSSNQTAGPAVQQSFDNGPVSIWSQLRDRSRDPANAAVKEKLPPEYRKLIERYYREMSDGSQK